MARKYVQTKVKPPAHFARPEKWSAVADTTAEAHFGSGGLTAGGGWRLYRLRQRPNTANPWRNFRLMAMNSRAGRTVFRLAWHAAEERIADTADQRRLFQLDLDLYAWAVDWMGRSVYKKERGG